MLSKRFPDSLQTRNKDTLSFLEQVLKLSTINVTTTDFHPLQVSNPYIKSFSTCRIFLILQFPSPAPKNRLPGKWFRTKWSWTFRRTLRNARKSAAGLCLCATQSVLEWTCMNPQATQGQRNQTHPNDRCRDCEDWFNLHAFPPCSCDSELACGRARNGHKESEALRSSIAPPRAAPLHHHQQLNQHYQRAPL